MGQKRRIFVVEDHPTTARALKMYLETQGYVVTLADSVASALETTDSAPFDLLICDLSLPDGTGWELMKKLSADGPVRGIAYTASADTDDPRRSQKVGFIEHLVKGCSTDDLIGAIDRALNSKIGRRRKKTARHA